MVTVTSLIQDQKRQTMGTILRHKIFFYAFDNLGVFFPSMKTSFCEKLCKYDKVFLLIWCPPNLNIGGFFDFPSFQLRHQSILLISVTFHLRLSLKVPLISEIPLYSSRLRLSFPIISKTRKKFTLKVLTGWVSRATTFPGKGYCYGKEIFVIETFRSQLYVGISRTNYNNRILNQKKKVSLPTKEGVQLKKGSWTWVLSSRLNFHLNQFAVSFK